MYAIKDSEGNTPDLASFDSLGDAIAYVEGLHVEYVDAPAIETFTVNGRSAIRYLTDDTEHGISAGSEFYIDK